MLLAVGGSVGCSTSIMIGIVFCKRRCSAVAVVGAVLLRRRSG